MYSSLQDEIKTAEKLKVKDLVWSIILMPLEKSKIKMEDTVKRLRNVVETVAPTMHVNDTFAEDLKKIQQIDSGNKYEYVAAFIHH